MSEEKEEKKTFAEWDKLRRFNSSKKKSGNFMAAAAFLFLMYLGGAYSKREIPFILPLVYFSSSILGFYFVWSDKSNTSVDKILKLKDLNILFWTFFGGWPGVYIAKRILEYKNRNTYYEIALFLLSGLNMFIYKYITTH